MRQALNSPSATAVGPYSLGIDSDGLVFCSGQTPVDPETNALVTGGIAAQTEQCLRNLFSVLADASLGPDDVIRVGVFLTNMDDFSAMNEVYARQFTEPFPARTTIGVASLPLGADIEIELIARRA